jgi:hypothetical protein
MYEAVHIYAINEHQGFLSFGATAPISALAYLHETLRFISVY